MDWEERYSAPAPPTPSHSFSTFQWGPSSKSMPRAEVLSLKRSWGGGGVGAQYLALCKVKPGREALEV